MADHGRSTDQEEPCKENLHVLPEELKQHHHSQVAVSRAASMGRYARLKKNMHLLPEETNQQHHPQVAVSCAASKGRSRAGWMSKERSTPEDINLEKFSDTFKCFLPDPPGTNAYVFSGRPVVLKQRKPPEVRNALRERRMAYKHSTARNHAEVALRKHNRANNTKFELVEVRVFSIFYEFGGGCIHYNFTAKQPEDHQSDDTGSTKLFFSEVDYWFRNENDVLLCCIVGENDAGHAMLAKTTSLLFTQVAKHTEVVIVLVLTILIQTVIAQTQTAISM
ncbi:unnamed protein product [Alopecurus aequalis]